MKKAVTTALIALVGGLVAVLVIILVVWFAFTDATLQTLRDLVIIALGVFLLILLITLVGVGAALFGLVSALRGVLPEYAEKGSSALDRVTGTSGYVGERVVSPFIKVSAAAAGARAAVQTLVRRRDGSS